MNLPQALKREKKRMGKLVFIIGDGAWNVHGKELRRDLTDHGAKSTPQGIENRGQQKGAAD